MALEPAVDFAGNVTHGKLINNFNALGAIDKTAGNSEAVKLKGIYYVEATWNPASIADGNEVANDVTLTGVALGDLAIASFSLDVSDLVLDAQVTAADTVTAVLANNTGGNVDLDSGTLRILVFDVT